MSISTARKLSIAGGSKIIRQLQNQAAVGFCSTSRREAANYHETRPSHLGVKISSFGFRKGLESGTLNPKP